MRTSALLRAGSTMLSASGRIELIIGPMFAGKTTELMNRIKREIHARRSCFVIKYAKDVRYDKEAVASHDQLTLKAQAAVSRLADVQDTWKGYDVVAVDEGQFFPDLVEFCNRAADSGKIVFVSALDGDYLRKPFGQICELVPYCESIDKMTAVCMMCHSRQASFTRRTVDSDEQELIGGADMYIATCRQCYNEEAAPSRAAMQSVKQAIKEVEDACLAISKNKTKSLAEAGEALTSTPSRNGASNDTPVLSSADTSAGRVAAARDHVEKLSPAGPVKHNREATPQAINFDSPVVQRTRVEA